MRKTSVLLLAVSLAFQVPHLRADIAAIHPSALPQETAVLGALDDAKQLEPYSRSWTMNGIIRLRRTRWPRGWARTSGF